MRRILVLEDDGRKLQASQPLDRALAQGGAPVPDQHQLQLGMELTRDALQRIGKLIGAVACGYDDGNRRP